MTIAAQKQIAVQALALPRKARQRLAQQLWDSLELEEESISRKEWSKAWNAELETRMADIESGKVKCVSPAEARKQWNKILGKT